MTPGSPWGCHSTPIAPPYGADPPPPLVIVAVAPECAWAWAALYCCHSSSSCEGRATRKPPLACTAIARGQASLFTDTLKARR